jgi:[acyl-carrier-protein] S-malonyltransferase
LEQQLRSLVRWTESVEAMIANGVDTFVECGVGEVLGGLIKRISRDVSNLKVNDPDSLAATAEALQTQGVGA